MNKVTFPLKPGMQNAQVGNLQDALRAFLDRLALLGSNPTLRAQIIPKLEQEGISQSYGSATKDLVKSFQTERGLPVSGEVDENTSNIMNKVMQELGLLDALDSTNFFIVSGNVKREDGLPLYGAHLIATHEIDGKVIRLGEDSSNHEGQFDIRYQVLHPMPDCLSISYFIRPHGQSFVS
jgi:hypothetical protein